MRTADRTFASSEPSQNIVHKAFLIEQICLLLAVQIVFINLLSHFSSPLNHLLPAALLHMRVSSAFAVLSAVLALFFTEAGRSRRFHLTAGILAALTALTGAASFWAQTSQFDIFLDVSQFPQRQGPGHALSLASVLLGIVIFLISSRESLFSRIADAVASCLAFLVLIHLSVFVFEFVQMPGASAADLPAIPTLVCFALLTPVIILRRAQYGVFSVLLGNGIGGRLARILAPVLVILPFLRELGRAYLINAQLVPARYTSAVFTSVAIAVSFVLLLLLVRLMNGMQDEIHDLTLRDELTGLYNFRGFNLFADQAFRLARRARLPFGVLFVDMDNLKIINDEFGHSVGSVSLVETAKILTANFRETDVIGRLGGDEFVVAGQFEAQEISAAIDRLRSSAASKTLLAGKRFSLSLSMGYASSDHTVEETLKSIVTRADKAMYKEKRAKKRLSVE